MVAKKNALVYSVHFIVGESSKNIPYPTKYLGYEIVGHKVKGWISKRVFQKTKHTKFSEKRTFLTPWYAHEIRNKEIRTKKCSLFGKFGLLFLETRFEIRPFTLLPTKSSSKVKNLLYIYLFKVNNRNTSKGCEIDSKLTMKTPEQRHWRRSGVFIVTFEHISHLFLAFVVIFEQAKC